MKIITQQLLFFLVMSIDFDPEFSRSGVSATKLSSHRSYDVCFSIDGTSPFEHGVSPFKVKITPPPLNQEILPEYAELYLNPNPNSASTDDEPPSYGSQAYYEGATVKQESSTTHHQTDAHHSKSESDDEGSNSALAEIHKPPFNEPPSYDESKTTEQGSSTTRPKPKTEDERNDEIKQNELNKKREKERKKEQKRKGKEQEKDSEKEDNDKRIKVTKEKMLSTIKRESNNFFHHTWNVHKLTELHLLFSILPGEATGVNDEHAVIIHNLKNTVYAAKTTYEDRKYGITSVAVTLRTFSSEDTYQDYMAFHLSVIQELELAGVQVTKVIAYGQYYLGTVKEAYVTELPPYSLSTRFDRERFEPAVLHALWYLLILEVEEMHRAEIVHRDLTLKNIWLDSNMKVIIGGFHSSTKIEHITPENKFESSVMYSAPKNELEPENQHFHKYNEMYYILIVLISCIDGLIWALTKDLAEINAQKINFNGMVMRDPDDFKSPLCSLDGELYELDPVAGRCLKSLLETKDKNNPSLEYCKGILRDGRTKDQIEELLRTKFH